MRTKRHLRRQAQGISLLESLIAMAVASAGLLGLLSMQTLLARSADAAKQRSEAVRLADEQIESMRLYTKIATTPGHLAWADLAAGTDAVSTNATYTRRWTIDGSAADTLRQVTVTMSWQDRAGEAQQIVLSSVIAQMDPADVGALGFPLPANTTLKRPKNRNLNIPVPARELGNGKSVYQLASNFAVVFNNNSGYVVQRCDHLVTSEADLATGCQEYDALILAGYVSRTTGSFPTGLGISTAGLTGLDSARSAQCSFDDARNQTTNALIDGYKYYLCILPVTTGSTWSGTVRLTGLASGTDHRVCRFQYASAAGLSANARNVQPYVNVADSLDSQSYVITTATSCPTVGGLPTTIHQVCTADNTGRAAECPAS